VKGELHPDTLRAFARFWVQRVPEGEQPEFIMALDQRIRGLLGNDAWLTLIASYA
jgi:hypothetical protein